MKKMKTNEDTVKRLLLFLVFLGIVAVSFAQPAASSTTMSSVSAYSYEGNRAGVEKLKMNVYILGRVSKPGLYLVPDDTDFITLLALAGGPTEDAKLTKIRIVRPENAALDKKTEPKIVWLNLKKYMETADTKYLATNTQVSKVIDESGEEKEATIYDLRLQPGDTVIISGTIFYAFSKVADFLSKIAIALSVYNLVTNLK
jgi:hypothetical protein